MRYIVNTLYYICVVVVPIGTIYDITAFVRRLIHSWKTMPCRCTTAKNDFTNVSISHLSTRGMYKNSKMIVKNSALQAGRNKKRE